jgi:hypothetical protein
MVGRICMALSRGQICCGSWGLHAVVDKLFLRHSSAEPDTWRRIAITVRARFRLTENAGAASLPRPPQHHTHGALHRAAADTLQGFLALKQRTVAVFDSGRQKGKPTNRPVWTMVSTRKLIPKSGSSRFYSNTSGLRYLDLASDTFP